LNTYKLKISYDGSDFLGWQIQPKGRTIQGELNSVLETICKSREIKTIGSGRTDAGVHAYEQIVRIEIPIKLSSEALRAGINSLIDKSIRLLEVVECEESFHPIFQAQSKEYLYLLSTEKIQPPFIRKFITHFPYKLSLDKMQKACVVFEGTHDFLGFSTKGTEVKSTVRSIFSCSIELKTDGFLGEHYQISISGSGFLKQMVRLMAGAILDVGRNKLELKDIQDLLSSGEDRKVSAVMPPNGLYLNKVIY